MFFPGMNIGQGVDSFTQLLRQGYKDQQDLNIAQQKMMADQAQADALLGLRQAELEAETSPIVVPEHIFNYATKPERVFSDYQAGFEGRTPDPAPRPTPEELFASGLSYDDQGRIVAPPKLAEQFFSTYRGNVSSAAQAFQAGAKQKTAAQLAKEASDRFNKGLESKERIAGQADKTRLTIAQMQEGLNRDRLAIAKKIAEIRAEALAKGKGTKVLDSLDKEKREAEATQRTLLSQWTQGLIPELNYRETLAGQRQIIKTINERIDRERARLGETPAPQASPRPPSADMKARFEAWYSSNKTKLNDRGISREQAEASYYNKMSK